MHKKRKISFWGELRRLTAAELKILLKKHRGNAQLYGMIKKQLKRRIKEEEIERMLLHVPDNENYHAFFDGDEVKAELKDSDLAHGYEVFERQGKVVI